MESNVEPKIPNPEQTDLQGNSNMQPSESASMDSATRYVGDIMDKVSAAGDKAANYAKSFMEDNEKLKYVFGVLCFALLLFIIYYGYDIVLPMQTSKTLIVVSLFLTALVGGIMYSNKNHDKKSALVPLELNKF